ncbi:hypothetical protein SDC49_19435 [Lactobacillus sp. R2/2]|nr:hypothetical protein [Lactobacillus sp. R2/2]
MRKRIDRESNQKNQYKQQLEDSQKRIETLTEKLKSVRNDEEGKDKRIIIQTYIKQLAKMKN